MSEVSDFDDAQSFAKLEQMRRLPNVWLQLICTSRTPKGDLAWSLTVSYTAWKKRLQPGTALFIENHRRPWRNRRVEVTGVSRRYIETVDTDVPTPDGEGEGSMRRRFELPPAAFTRMLSKDSCEILAQQDGPLFDVNGRQLDEKLLAGQPLFTIQVL